MSNLLQLQGGIKSYGTKLLFDEAEFAINDGEHVGVIGPNGAGKTTLFKILTSQETLDDGKIIKSKDLNIGYLAQHDQWGPEQTVEDYLETGCITPLWQLKSLGHGFGLTDDHYSRPVKSLSGGFRMRCKLLYLIGQEPSLMLLDEPTNYLDLETTLVLEEFLQSYKGAFLLISHDREFLRRTTDHILEIEQGQITKFNGNLDDYFEQKEMLRSQLEARAGSLQDKKDEILKFVARFGAKATKAKQAQSRLKLLDKMETIELKALPVSATIRIPAPVKTGKVILKLSNAELGYGDKTILRNIDYILQNGEHIAIVGLNGAGKSTFLKALAGVMAPLKGEVEQGYNVSIGYYAQHVAESLDSSGRVLDQMMAKAHTDILPQDALNMAGSLLFSGDDVRKKISVLSGGERSRVALGQILLQRAPCLILDEPTNHLDFQTVEALTQALTNYAGTVVVVSHDRSFVRRIGKKIVEINHGHVTLYPGSYDDYVWSLQNGVLGQRGGTKPTPKQETRETSPSDKIKSADKFNYKEVKKNLERDIKKCERALSESDVTLKDLNSQVFTLNEVINSQHAQSQADAIREIGEVQAKINFLEEEWLKITEKKEQAEKDLRKLHE
jgi:ATP-binding cassette subfamily F protein 3